MAPQGSPAPLEFGGPLGAAALMLLLPGTMFHLLLAARSAPARLLVPAPLPAPGALWSRGAALLWLGWLGLQAAFYLLPARKMAEGQELKDKSRLRYPVNGAGGGAGPFRGSCAWGGAPGLGGLTRLHTPSLHPLLQPLLLLGTSAAAGVT